MTAPQFDQAAFAAFMAQQQAQTAPAPAQYPQHQPGYPVAPQGFPQPQMPQGYAPQAPAQPLANGTLDDFFSQPSAGWGPAWSFKDKPIGHGYVGIVARGVTNGDITQQTTPGSNPQPLFYKDGRPKLVMKVAMSVQPDQTYVEGKAQWYVQGQGRDELARAMAEVGAPAGPPEVGAVISVTLSGKSDNTFGTKTNQFTVRYQRPEGAAATPVPAPVAEVPAPAAPVAPQVPAAPVAPPAPPAPAANGLPADKAALLAQLTGQSAGS